MNWPERIVEIQCQGAAMLGIYHPVERPGSVAFVFVVGGPQYRVGSHRMFVELARGLAADGYPVLRFDCRGMGDSDGSFSSFEHLDMDIAAAVDSAKSLSNARSIVLLGLCDGASASAMYASKDERIGGLVLLNPWVSTPQGEARARLKHYYVRQFTNRNFWRKLLSGRLAIRESVWSLLGFARSASQRSRGRGESYIARMLTAMNELNGKILVVLSEDDLVAREFSTLVSNDQGWRGLTLRHNVSVAHVEGADHTFSAENEIDGVCRRVSEWAKVAVAADR